MTIRKKILLYFSLSSSILIALSFGFIYKLLSEHRVEKFHQRQKEKIITTLQLISEFKELDESIFLALDQVTIHDFYDEKLLLFNNEKRNIYTSIDDLKISNTETILNYLSEVNSTYVSVENNYDVIGLFMKINDETFYGISKAFDWHGYQKLQFLKDVLIILFFLILIITIILANFLANKITRPISQFTQEINSYDFLTEYIPLKTDNKTSEIVFLKERFNELMKRSNEAFNFQKHAIRHISHELKTPIAILVSNFEVLEKETDPEKLRALLKRQKEDTRILSEIIQSLLEISKVETNSQPTLESFRIDEYLFDLTNELKLIHSNFSFSINYNDTDLEFSNLVVKANKRLIGLVLTNLMLNCIHYSSNSQAGIDIETSEGFISLKFTNKGAIIKEEEEQYLFKHFFRGQNSKGKRGFGLGLVLVDKIVNLYDGDISYSSDEGHVNIFVLKLKSSQP